jgi:hypothetical protein
MRKIIRGHQRPSEVIISGNKRSSEVIRGHQIAEVVPRS